MKDKIMKLDSIKRIHGKKSRDNSNRDQIQQKNETSHDKNMNSGSYELEEQDFEKELSDEEILFE